MNIDMTLKPASLREEANVRGEGYLFSFDIAGVREEAKTFTCNHCNQIVIIQPKCDPYDLGGMCRLCDRMICPKCVDFGKCTPIEKRLEEEERKYLRRWAMRM